MIEVKHLTFSYGKEPFIEDMNFSVKKGEIFGFLGPSGAGKSTLEKIIIGLIPGYQGSVTVDGIESNHHGKDFYENIGVDFEFSTMYEKMTARDNLRFFASLYQGKSRNIDELLRQMALLDSADKKVSAYSKGMKSRLNFIKALIHDPEVLLLDEPTSGLDPTNSRIMKEAILTEKERGKTVLLTTHNMMDAAELCDRVAFIVDGRICALDTPHHLIMKRGADKVTYTWNEGRFEQSGECLLSELSGDARLQELIARNKVTSIHSSEPSLNDIFMEVTEAAGMRFWNVLKFNIKQQYSYGFYLLYLFLAAVYSLIIFLLPQSWKTMAIAIIIFFDPAAVGLFFMGGILLLEKSQRLPGAIAVSPIRAWEYVAANITAMTIVSLIACLIIGTIGGTPSMGRLLLGTVLNGILFTMIGIAIATVIVDLNQFVLANVPIMLILQFVPIFYLLNPDKTVLKVFPTAAVLDMMRGMAPSPVAVTFLVALIVAAAVVSVKAIQRLWRRAGGAKA